MNTAALRVAREAVGYTQTDLAAASGLPQPDLSRWERGLRAPDADEVVTLAVHLQVPVGFLTGDERVTQPIHRTQRQESKRTERLVNGRLELARRSASRLLQDIIIEPAYSFPTLDDRVSDDPEQAAADVRRVWRVPRGPIVDLADVVESAGVVVLPVDFGADNIRAAYVNPRGDHRWCFLNTRADDGAAVRFDLAHELGHAMLHWDRFEAPTGKDAEAQAHRFAAALLMPADDIRTTFAHTSPSLPELTLLRKQWGVSVQALVRRARDLEGISEQTYTRLYKQMSAHGWRSARGEPGKLAIERPTILAEAMQIHREHHGYTEQELAVIADLPHGRLCELLPDYFVPTVRKPLLRAVGHDSI